MWLKIGSLNWDFWDEQDFLSESEFSECLNHDSQDSHDDHDSDDFVFNQGHPSILKIPVQTIAVILEILKS